MNLAITESIIKKEIARMASIKPSVSIARHEYDLKLTIALGQKTADAIFAPDALNLSLDSFSSMYLLPMLQAMQIAVMTE